MGEKRTDPRKKTRPGRNRRQEKDDPHGTKRFLPKEKISNIGGRMKNLKRDIGPKTWEKDNKKLRLGEGG